MEIEEVRIRYMIRRDMPAVLRIENEGSEHPWREGDFLAGLRQHACIGIVAEASAQVVGFMLYELYPSRLYILNLAVAKEVRRRGVGSELVSHIGDGSEKESHPGSQKVNLAVKN